jgi:hypothetical protein
MAGVAGVAVVADVVVGTVIVVTGAAVVVVIDVVVDVVGAVVVVDGLLVVARVGDVVSDEPLVAVRRPSAPQPASTTAASPSPIPMRVPIRFTAANGSDAAPVAGSTTRPTRS